MLFAVNLKGLEQASIEVPYATHGSLPAMAIDNDIHYDVPLDDACLRT